MNAVVRGASDADSLTQGRRELAGCAKGLALLISKYIYSRCCQLKLAHVTQIPRVPVFVKTLYSTPSRVSQHVEAAVKYARYMCDTALKDRRRDIRISTVWSNSQPYESSPASGSSEAWPLAFNPFHLQTPLLDVMCIKSSTTPPSIDHRLINLHHSAMLLYHGRVAEAHDPGQDCHRWAVPENQQEDLTTIYWHGWLLFQALHLFSLRPALQSVDGMHVDCSISGAI
jgi:hypothetical protein